MCQMSRKKMWSMWKSIHQETKTILSLYQHEKKASKKFEIKACLIFGYFVILIQFWSVLIRFWQKLELLKNIGANKTIFLAFFRTNFWTKCDGTLTRFITALVSAILYFCQLCITKIWKSNKSDKIRTCYLPVICGQRRNNFRPNFAQFWLFLVSV